MRLALFGMQNRTFGPYCVQNPMRACRTWPAPTETNRICLALFGMPNRTPWSLLRAESNEHGMRNRTHLVPVRQPLTGHY
jgi:hypothetical protein